jgi:hypothetical protein
VDLTSWYIADNLPVEGAEETEQKVQEYRVTLERWSGQNWISAETKRLCGLALYGWLREQKTGQALDETSAKILEETRAYIDLRNYPEDLRAQVLEEAIKAINRLKA